MERIHFGFLMIFCLVIAFGCAQQKPLVIEEFVQQKVIVKEKPITVKEEGSEPSAEQKKAEKKVVSSPVVVPDGSVYFPDPTKGYIKNQTYNIFIKAWLDRDFKPGVREAPDLCLPPKAIAEAVMPLGDHIVYAEGMIQTKEFGWKSVGVASKRVSIDHRVYCSGHYGWYVVFGQGDFRR